jgi:hypothetical protein
MFTQQSILALDTSISIILGLFLLFNPTMLSFVDDKVGQLLGFFLLSFSYGTYSALKTRKQKGIEIALQVKSLTWIFKALFIYNNGNNQEFLSTLPMVGLLTYAANWLGEHSCSNHCSHYKQRRNILRKKINALKKRARNHPTVHDGYKTD